MYIDKIAHIIVSGTELIIPTDYVSMWKYYGYLNNHLKHNDNTKFVDEIPDFSFSPCSFPILYIQCEEAVEDPFLNMEGELI